MLSITDHIQIPMEEFDFSYARSGGPGGQNVNKVNSKAIMRWSVMSSPSIPPGVKLRFYDAYSSRLTTDGELVLTSQKYRDQGRNVDDCLEKLKTMLLAVVDPPIERRATKPTRTSVVQRQESKKKVSEKKQGRRSPRFDD